MSETEKLSKRLNDGIDDAWKGCGIVLAIIVILVAAFTIFIMLNV